jgi:hypothetical protein
MTLLLGTLTLSASENPLALPQPLIDAVTTVVRTGKPLAATVIAAGEEPYSMEEDLGEERKIGLLDFASAQPTVSCRFKDGNDADAEEVGLVVFQLRWAKGSSLLITAFALRGAGDGTKIVDLVDVDLMREPSPEDVDRQVSPLLRWAETQGEAVARATVARDWTTVRTHLRPLDDAALAAAIVKHEGEEGTLPPGVATDGVLGRLARRWTDDLFRRGLSPKAKALYAGHVVEALDEDGGTEVKVYLLIPEGPAEPGIDMQFPAVFEFELEGDVVDGVVIPRDIDLDLDQL